MQRLAGIRSVRWSGPASSCTRPLPSHMSSTQSQAPPVTTQDQLPPNCPLPKVSNLLSPKLAPVSHSPRSSLLRAPADDPSDDFQTNTTSLPAPTHVARPGTNIPPHPNVYIGGLPPHFPEEQLFNMTKEFGPVLSVKTFTKPEQPTGYGFVLFQRRDSAQRCIETLRKCRNLRSSWSKKVHGVPRTLYGKVQISRADAPPKKDSFRAKMERLNDESSTGLYIEGLPLTTDEPALAALMAPHKIISSRLFQTLLSHPPRIIALVKLETRASAEQTIERLHGRMIRGWGDTGRRILVKFADSAEQRELRRQRVVQEYQFSSKLTIAQAALLNMHGPQVLFQRSQPFPDANFGPTPTTSATNPPSASVTRGPFGRRSDHPNDARNRRTGSVSAAAGARNGSTPAEGLYLAMHAQRARTRGVPDHLGENELPSPQANLPGMVNHNKIIKHTGMYDARSLTSDLGGLSIFRSQPLGRSSTTTITPYFSSTNKRLRPSQTFNHSSNSYGDVFCDRKFTGELVGAFRPAGTTKGACNVSEHRSTYDITDSLLASPALTCSSHGRTPSTLTPATPLCGTFSGGEGFEGLPAVGTNFKSKERDVTITTGSALEEC